MLLPSTSHESSNNHSQGQIEAERLIQAALDALSAHVAILDDDGEIIAVNEAWRSFAQANGLNSASYGIGMNYLGVCDLAVQRNSADANIVGRGIRDILSGTLNEFEMEYPCHSPTQRRWFVVRVSRFQWYRDVRLIVAHQNVTEIKRVQIELSQSKRRLEAILDNVNNAILTIDSKGHILTVNRAAVRVFGYQPDELIGKHLRLIVDDPLEDNAALRRLNGEHGHEITGIRRDGSPFPIYISLGRLDFEDGSAYTCIIQDITYRKRMEEEMLETERMRVALDKERELRVLKNRFLSMMSHELRTPLTSIGLSYDMLKKYGAVSTPLERDQALDNIRVQVELLSDMVTDVMTLSRGDADGLHINTERLDLITYCRDIIEEFQFNYHKTHHIDFDCPNPSIYAEVDRKMLRRALTNLIVNAIKYSPRGGRVLFHLSASASEALIEVRDSGIGIPPEDQARLFEPFHRAGNVSNISGTGLGLPITKQAIELHHGTISFHSAVNVGTIFYIRLPLQQPQL